MSAAVSAPVPLLFNEIVIGSSVCMCKRTLRKFKRIVITSSLTPSRVENSCSTPSIFTCVIAAPGSEDNKTLRNELPIVTPYPRSSGEIVNLP